MCLILWLSVCQTGTGKPVCLSHIIELWYVFFSQYVQILSSYDIILQYVYQILSSYDLFFNGMFLRYQAMVFFPSVQKYFNM